MSIIKVENLSWSAGGRQILQKLSLDVSEDEVLGLIGPNGSGKSSLLRCIAGIIEPEHGAVLYGDRPLNALSVRARAHHLAFVEQMQQTSTDMCVSEVVSLGRIPYRRRFGALTMADRAIVAAALQTMDLSALADRSWRNMSGGEQQRTNIARALAQRAKVLLLDEPTNHLDIRHQLDVLKLVRDLPQAKIVCLHDLGLAARYCDRLAVMKNGKLVEIGKPETILTPDLFRKVFEIEAHIEINAEGKCDVKVLH
ncbi:ABC transporter ATP-binding protein [Maritalea sp. S77]|uniref:ABC transporter ATP-binding protein n=1 Tax=Maritalea sp. S77 TaxID=3415125 RepID=UPI003C7EB7B5